MSGVGSAEEEALEIARAALVRIRDSSGRYYGESTIVPAIARDALARIDELVPRPQVPSPLAGKAHSTSGNVNAARAGVNRHATPGRLF